MKRIASLIVCVLLAFVGMAYAETDIDLSGYNVEDLIELQKQISDTLFEKGNAMLYDGDYIVGKDIPEGDFVITLHSEDRTLVVWVYKTATSRDEYDNAGSERDWHDYYTRADLSGKSDLRVSLSDGQMLTVRGYEQCAATISKIEPLFE